MLMTIQRRKIIAFFGIFVEIVALLLMSFGLYIREVGTGNPVGSVYIILGCILATGTAMVLLLITPQRASRLMAIFFIIVLVAQICAIAAVISALQR